jgi:DNA topoisomerase-1
MHILIITEKNNTAIRIATILSENKMRKSFSNRVPIFNFEANGNKYTVIGLRGHILTLDYPREFNIWNKVEPEQLIDVQPYKRHDALYIVKALQQVAKDINMVIIATDYDREGELIGTEALEVITDKNLNLEVKRARFSAMTKSEVDDAFTHLTEIDYNLSKSAETRQLIDLVWGATLTRFISLSSGQTGRDFLSVGRVQSPTLALIVDKEIEIQKFKPEPYWKLEAKVTTSPPFTAVHNKGRFFDQKEVDALLKKLKGTKEGKVKDLKVEVKRDLPPSPFNTTSFLAAVTAFGISAAKAMSIAEDLYSRGYISYPRTDNTVYPQSLNLYSVLSRLKETEFKPIVEEVLAQGRLRPSRGKSETTDHPPIYPTDAAPKGKLRRDEWQVYELVVRRFLATVSPAASVRMTDLDVLIKDEVFKAEGKKFLELGWRKYYPYFKLDEKTIPDDLKEGQVVPIEDITKLEKTTKPPKRYTQGHLIQKMEELGLGTKSTRHEIIQKLYSRGYLEGGSPTPTGSGFAVIKALEDYAETITKPNMTATLEDDMTLIADGKKQQSEVVDESKDMLKDVFKILVPNRDKIGDEIRKALQDQNVISECRGCKKAGRKGHLVIKRSRRGKRFVGCVNYPTCMVSYALPQRGKVVTYPDPCPVCDAPQVKIVAARRRPWLTCINLECPSKKDRKKPKSTSEEE